MVKSFISILITLPLLAFLTGCLSSESPERLLPLVLDNKEMAYDVTKAEKGLIEERIDVRSYFVVRERISLSFGSVGGYLKEIHVFNGQTVHKGDILAELDTGFLDFQYEMERLKLEQARVLYSEISGSNADETDRKKAYCILTEQMIRTEQAEYHQSLAQLKAPADGFIVFRSSQFEPGDYIPPHTKVLQMNEPGNIEIHYNGSSADSFYSGMIVDYVIPNKLNGFRNTGVYKAEVVQTPRETPWREDVSFSGDIYLRPVGEVSPQAKRGEYCYITLTVHKKEDAILVPRESVETRYDGSFVMVLNKDNRPEERLVQTGIETPEMIEIVRGVEEGELVFNK